MEAVIWKNNVVAIEKYGTKKIKGRISITNPLPSGYITLTLATLSITSTLVRPIKT